MEQLPTSKYFFCLGDHASTSTDFTFRSARSPEQHSKRTYRNIQGTEQVHSILPQLIEPHLAVFRIAYNDHLLLFKLMDPVNASLLYAVSALFLTEAWRIAGKGLGSSSS